MPSAERKHQSWYFIAQDIPILWINWQRGGGHITESIYRLKEATYTSLRVLFCLLSIQEEYNRTITRFPTAKTVQKGLQLKCNLYSHGFIFKCKSFIGSLSQYNNLILLVIWHSTHFTSPSTNTLGKIWVQLNLTFLYIFVL